MVRQWQELFFERRYSEVDLSDNPDFAAVAGAFGIASLHVDRADRVEQALRDLLDTPGPALLHVAIDQAANVWPLVPPRSEARRVGNECVSPCRSGGAPYP